MAMKKAGKEAMVMEKTGLLLDPYFTATKLGWILDRTKDARDLATTGELWRHDRQLSHLASGRVEGCMSLTLPMPAARASITFTKMIGTMICLLSLMCPRSGLPKVMDCAAEFGMCEASLFHAELPIRGVAGDQQAAAIGQGCFSPGALKSTYGTGCFIIINTGETPVASKIGF